MKTITRGLMKMTGPSKATVVIADVLWAGHIPTYHKLWVKALLEQGHSVVSLSPNPGDVAEACRPTKIEGPAHFRAFRISTSTFSSGTSADKKAAPRLLLSIIRPWLNHVGQVLPFARALHGLIWWLRLDKAVDAFCPEADIVLVPYLDGPFTAHGLHGRLIDCVFKFPWAGLMISPTEFRRPDLRPIRLRALSRFSAFRSVNCRAVGFLDEAAVQNIRQFTRELPVILFPDLTDETPPMAQHPEIQEVRAKAGNRKIVLLAGELSKRKGILVVPEKPLFCQAI